MFKKFTSLLLSLCVVLGIMSCHNDVGDVNPESEQTKKITVPLEFDEITGELIGYVYDNFNNPVSGANVMIYSGETTTNDFGLFSFQSAKLDPQGTFIKVEKSGYLVGSDLVYPNSNGKGTARIRMLEVMNLPAFEASKGGIVEITGGGTLTFPPSSLIRPNGSVYNGAVRSTAYRLSPNDPALGSKMAGGLLGIDKEGRHRVLNTFGIIAIELSSFDNQKLKMKSDKSAELSFPIDAELQSLDLDDIVAWNFDLQEGVWKEEIETTNNQQNSFTTINALGFWNMATHSGVSQVCGRLIYSNELPAKNYVIQIVNNGLPSRIGLTDQDGYFCGKMPKEENLKLQVMHPICGDILLELIIGPFEEVGTIGDIILDIDEKYISGKVECSGVGHNNAIIITSSNGQTNFFYPNANGSFSINLEEIVCGLTSNFTIFAFDNATGMSSEPKVLDTEFNESLNLEVCQSECLANGVFIFEKEDYCEDGPYRRVIVEVAHGSGEYTYEWQDGSSHFYFDDPIPGDICVNVTDIVTGCEYEFCNEVFNHKRLSIKSIYSLNTECLITSGFVELEVEGGRGAYQYEWTGPDGYSSNESKVEDLPPGEYSLVVTDESECEASETIEVYDVTTPIELSLEDYCALSIITIEENKGYKPYTFKWNVSDAIPSGNQLFVYSPGVYSLTVTDANLCARSTSLTISKVGFLPEIDPNYECAAGIISFSNVQSEYEYQYQSIGSSEIVPIDVSNGKLEILILEAGYRFELIAINPEYSECSTSLEVNLPKFEGLVIGEVTNPSCESCEDGSIEYEVITSADCQGCSLGEAKVINAETETDVTNLNNDQQLGIGEYYVIILDENSGCYIAHSLVILE